MPKEKYTKQQRLAIGQQIYTGEMSRFDAAAHYGIDLTTARDYMRLFRDVHGLPPKNTLAGREMSRKWTDRSDDREDYSHMTREQLLQEIIQLKRTVKILQQVG